MRSVEPSVRNRANYQVRRVHETNVPAAEVASKGAPPKGSLVIADDTGNICRRDDLKGALRLTA
jgi:hypothetical protein